MLPMKKNSRNVDLMFEIGSIRHVDRGWKQGFGERCANVAEHTLRVMWIALIISRMEGKGDEGKIMKIALAHDLAESRTGDVWHLQKKYINDDEGSALNDTLQDTSLEDFSELILGEYGDRKSIEAKIVKDADNLDCDLELVEMLSRGNKLLDSLRDKRKIVFEQKLHTKSAKALWKKIYSTDPFSWHTTANKWLHGAKNGK